MSAPPPVPALPDTERRTAYTISAQTGPFAVTFAIYGDGTDSAAWVEVWLNSVQLAPGGFVLSSPSGAVATLPRPITDAVITLASASTGNLQIIGARRPRRTSQFSESRGVPARDLNQAFSDLAAQSRENWDQINSRVLSVPGGEVIRPVPTLAARQGKAAGYDTLGNPNAIVAVPAGSVAFTAFGIAWAEAADNVAAAALLPQTAHALSVKDYGAAGDGVTDDSVAIHNAINAATLAQTALYFPAGLYKITQDKVLTQTVFPSITGIKCYGDGMFQSILNLFPTPGTPIHLYDGSSDLTHRQARFEFVDLGFRGMDASLFTDNTSIPDESYGFTQYGDNTVALDFDFKFSRCWFQYFATLFEYKGNNGTDSDTLVQCNIRNIKNNVFVLNNIQTFNIELIAVNIEVIYGNIFNWTHGGGSINWYGGSCIMSVPTNPINYFILTSSTQSGLSAIPCTFNGVRFEMRNVQNGLVNLGATNQIGFVFNSCIFDTFSPTDLVDWCVVNVYNRVLFRDCTFYEFGAGKTSFVVSDNATGQVQYGQAGTIIFESCMLPVDFSDRCSVTSYTGKIEARDCYGNNVGSVSNGMHWAHDFDMHWNAGIPGLYSAWLPGHTPGAPGPDDRPVSAGSVSDSSMRTKVAYLLLNGEVWPHNGAAAPNPVDMILRLPKNAIIKNIHLRKPHDASGDGTSIHWVIGNADKTATHGVTAAEQYQRAMSFDATNYFYMVGTTDNERNITLYSSSDGTPSGASPTGFGNGGFVIVEYI